MRLPRLTVRRVALALAALTTCGVGVAFAAGFTVTSSHVYAQNQTVTHTACNQTSSTAYDTYVNQSSPGSQYGNSKTLLVSGTSGSTKYAFVRFDLSGCSIPTTGGADSAVLNLYVTARSPNTAHTIALYPIYSSWTETGLTWNNWSSLTIGTPVSSFTNTVGSQSITVTQDVDTAIKAGTLWGWGLADTSGGGVQTTIASAENNSSSRRPSLTLTYAH